MAAIVHIYAPAGQPMTPWFREQMLETDSAAFAREILARSEWNGPWAVLSQITCPALLLVGDREDPDGHTARPATLMSNAGCVILPGLDHITASRPESPAASARR
jgi:pimeloyl-ACP methyl ester carboxylesterase